MSYRIIIEDEAKEVIHNINNILKMSDLTNYIYMFDIKNANGCEVAFHGNAEKIAKMYDVLTQYLVEKDPEILMRVITAWDRRMK